MSKKIDLVGQRFGRLTVVSPAPDIGSRTAWRCLCDCGASTIVKTYRLTTRKTKSCGCLQKQTRLIAAQTHGARGTRLYSIWHGMKDRATNRTNIHYADYGGRGITVCDEWQNDFTAFRDWALSHGYRDDLNIDRIDVNGNYEPINCRWNRCSFYNRRVVKKMSETKEHLMNAIIQRINDCNNLPLLHLILQLLIKSA